MPTQLKRYWKQNPRYSRFFRHSDPGDLATLMDSAWNSEGPGPDLMKEDLAKSENRELMLEFGRQVASIAIGSPGGDRDARQARESHSEHIAGCSPGCTSQA
jgi:hypothetical protein